ncbi:hypothetical protein RQP46_008037 [Phenoliferia psychrophenolica]
MASFSPLAPELLLHILDLSNEGEPAKERQRFRFAFGLISRAFYLATADSTELHVDNEQQARSLVAQLEREKEWVAQEERQAASGRTSHSATLSVTRTSNVRHLSILIAKGGAQIGFVELLHATPALVRLDLVFESADSISSGFEHALGRLKDLRHLRLGSGYDYLSPTVLVRSLTAHGKTLEVLNVACYHYHKEDYNLDNLSLPNLRTLRLQLESSSRDPPNTLLAILAARSTTGLQVLDLRETDESNISFKILQPLLHLVTNIRHFIWTPGYLGPFELWDYDRDGLLALLGAMTSLEYLHLPLWTIDRGFEGAVSGTQTDLALFDTLVALPSLQIIDLIVEGAELDHNRVITYLETCKPLRFLSIHFERERGRHYNRCTWTREQRDTVGEAADRAGVTFVCS